MKKRLGSLMMMVVIMMVAILPVSVVNAMTAQEGADWALARIGWNIDTDGYYGAQCKDFVNAFIQENWGFTPPGNAINLKDYNYPSGWQKIENTPDFLPQPGDIAVWAYGSYATYGHCGIITSANLSTFTSVDQNWYNANGTTGSPAALVTHNYSGFWGVIRPPYDSNDDTRSRWQITGTDGVNIRSGAGTSYSIVGAIAYQQYFYITERVQADGYTWGKVDNYNGVSGWCVLDYAVHVSGPVPELGDSTSSAIHGDENQHVNNGTYMLKNAQSGLMVDVTGGADSNGNPVVTYGFNGSDAQKFRIEHIGNGKYYLFAVCSGSGRVLDVMRTGNSTSGALTDGCVVDIYNNNDDPAQAIYVWPVGNGKYVLELASTPGRVIAPADEGSASTEGKQLILKTYTGADYEKWYLCNESGVRIDRALAGISVKNEISKIQYYVGETLQTDGLVLTASYNDGTTEDISSGYTTSYDFSSAGDKTVTLEYGGKTTTFRVSVIEKPESEKAVISVSSDECYAGTQTDVYVSLKSQNVYDGNMIIQYNSSKLKLVEATPCGTLANRHVVLNTDYDTDKIKVSFAGTSALVCDGNVIKLTFVAGENASGAAVVSVHESKMYGKDGNDIETDSTDGTINIEATVNSAEISNIVSESIDGRKVVTANVSSDEVICYLASYRDDVLTECDIQQPVDGKIELSVKDSDNVKLMMWNMAMKPLMNVKNIY